MTVGQPEVHWGSQRDTGTAGVILGLHMGHWDCWCDIGTDGGGTGTARGTLPQQRLEHKAVLVGVYRHTWLFFLGYWQRILEIGNNNAACFHVRVENCMDGALTDQISARSVSKAHIPAITASL